MYTKMKIQSLIIFPSSLNLLTCAGQYFLSLVKWKESTDFIYFDIGREEIGQPFGRGKVRIQLNNEKKIADERKKMRLAQIGV